MEIKDLKNKIERNDLNSASFIFQTDDDTNLIVDQYINEIASRKNLTTKFIDSQNDIPDSSFIEDTNLYLIRCDSFDDELLHNNLVVICKKSKNKDVIKIPKLEDWQVVDYALSIAKGMQKQDLEWMIQKYTGKYMMFIQDVLKISYFSEGLQKTVFDQMVKDGQLDYVSKLTVFDLTNAIIKRDIWAIAEVLKVRDYIDLTPMHFWTILSNSFRNIINIQLNPYCTYQQLGISDKQFYVIKKYNCGYYSKEQLVNIFELLSSIEYMYKFEELPIDDMIDYVIVKILGE